MVDRPVNVGKNRLGLFLIISGWLVAALLAAILVADVARQPPRIGVGDIVNVRVLGTLPDTPIDGDFTVAADGTVWLGQSYGAANVDGLTVGEAHSAVESHLRKILTAPAVTLSLAESAGRPIVSRLLPALGWVVASLLACLLAVTTVRSYTVPEPRGRWLQFGVGTLLWLMVVVAVAIFAFNERRERLRAQATLQEMAMR